MQNWLWFVQILAELLLFLFCQLVHSILGTIYSLKSLGTLFQSSLCQYFILALCSSYTVHSGLTQP